MAPIPSVPMMGLMPNYQDKSSMESSIRSQLDSIKGYFSDHCYAATIDNQPPLEFSDSQSDKEKLNDSSSQDDNLASILLSDHLPPMDNPSSVITPVGSSFASRSESKEDRDTASFSSFCESLQDSEFDLKDSSVKDIFISDIDVKNLIFNEDISLSKSPKVIVKKEPLNDISDSFLLSRSFDSVVCD